VNYLRIKLLACFIICTYAITTLALPTDWKDFSPVLVTPVKIDGITLKEVWINPNNKETILDREPIFKLLEDVLKAEHFFKIIKNVPQKKYLKRSWLSKYKIGIHFDENHLVLYMKIPLSLRKKSRLDLKPVQQFKGSLIQNSDFSSYINFNYTTTHEDNEFQRENLYNEYNINYKGHILNMGAHYQRDNEVNRYNREYTRYIYDNEKNHFRLILGDLQHNTQDLQEQFDGAGLTLQNDFSIKPSLLKTNFNKYEIDLSKPSTVEIFLNESRLYRGNHPAGVLNLNSLPLVIGQNSIKILITDANGKIQTLYYDSNYHSSLLPKGIWDYSFNVLEKSQIDENSQVEYIKESVVSMYSRYGFNDTFTTGMNFQNNEKNSLFGLEAVSHFKGFIFDIKPSLSFTKNEQYNSYSFGVQNIYDPFIQHQLTTRFQFRNFDEDFTLPSGTQNNIENQYTLNSSYSLNSQVNLGLGFQYQKYYYEEDPIQLSNFDISYRPISNLSISLRSQKDHTLNKDNSILLAVNWFERSHNLSGSHSYQSKNHQTRHQVNYHKKNNSNKYYLSASHDENHDSETKSSKLYGQVQTHKGTLRVDHQQTEKSAYTNTNLNFALAFTRHSFNLSDYISNSFVVLDSNSENNVFIDEENTEGFSNGNTYVKSGLTPYHDNTLKFNVNSLKIGEEIGNDRFTIKPRYKAGTYYKLKVVQQKSISFKVDGAKYLVGYLENKSNKYQFMTGKTGNAFIPNIKQGIYEVNFNGTKSTYSIIIRNNAGHTNLGTLHE
jgi:outer membrane usher protein